MSRVCPCASLVQSFGKDLEYQRKIDILTIVYLVPVVPPYAVAGSPQTGWKGWRILTATRTYHASTSLNQCLICPASVSNVQLSGLPLVPLSLFSLESHHFEFLSLAVSFGTQVDSDLMNCVYKHIESCEGRYKYITCCEVKKHHIKS